jgi:hypothetical protein
MTVVGVHPKQIPMMPLPPSRCGKLLCAVPVRFLLGVLAVGLGAAPERAQSVAPIRFRDASQPSGLDFILENHPTPQKHMIETMPGGLAVFDYDGDGLTDIYFTNGAVIPSLAKNPVKYLNRLYRNIGNMKLREVTAEAGVGGAGYSMGAAAADYDNDGDVDIFVAGVFRNVLYRNTGRGRFEDVTGTAGIKSDLWSVAAGWFDFDNDRWLDLFVVNYAEWSLAFDRFCGDGAAKIRVYCHPKYFQGLPNTLYRNRGDGTFEDVSTKAGLARHAGRGMSVAFADYDQDGFLDAFVTNDNLPNFLFRNRGDGSFEEVAILAGAALRDHGKPVASMGADFRDYDNDGLPDIHVTALAGETFPLFRNAGGGSFHDATYSSRMAAVSSSRSGWGNGFFDFNNDGWKDMFTANSHVNDRIEHFEATAYKQPNSIFANLGNGRFQDVSNEQGADFHKARAHRGIGFADLNHDGKIDVVVTALGEPTELWENVGPGGNNWIILKLIGTKSNRDGIGARVRIGDQHNWMTTAVGYASSSHDGVHFGIGKKQRIDRIEIRWPSGVVQALKSVEVNQVLQVTEPER